MEYSECLELEIITTPTAYFFINEENVKGKRTNKEFKGGKSYQYSSTTYEHRFIIWNADNDVLTISEYSTNCELLGNQIEIKFQKSQVLSVNIFETENDVQFLIATSLLVMRFSLHHPKKLRYPNSENFQYSIFYGIGDLNEMKRCVTPYFNANEITCANSILDPYTNNAYFNYGLSNGNIFSFIIQESNFTDIGNYFEMKESSLFSKIISGIISRPKPSDYTDISIIDMAYVEIDDQIYLVTVSRDNKLKLWSLKERYCVASEDLLASVLVANNSNRSMSTINYNSIISSHKIKSFFRSGIKTFPDTIVVYFHITLGKINFSNWIMIQIMDPHDKLYSKQPFQILNNINRAGDNLHLVDFEINYNIIKHESIGIWSLIYDSNVNGNGLYSMNWTSLIDDGNAEQYTCRIYNEANELYVHKEEHEDPQEAVIKKIFLPGFVTRSSIVNVINKMYEGMNKESLSARTSIEKLKQILVQIVESSVEQELLSNQNEENDCDVIELNHKIWFNILKAIIEEHYKLMHPLGIISVTGTIGLCRYGSISLMRYPNELERIMPSTSITDSLHRFYDQNSVVPGCTLLRYLNEFSRHIQSTGTWQSIEFQIFQLGKRPWDVSRQLLTLQINIPSLINSRLENQPEILESTVKLLETLDIENGLDSESNVENCRMSSLSMGMVHFATCQIIRDRVCLSIALITLLEPRILNSSHPEHIKLLVYRLERLIKSLISIHWLLNVRQESSVELNDVHKCQLEDLNLLENRFPDLIGDDILCLRVLQSVQNKFIAVSNHASSWQTKMKEEMSVIVNYLHPNSETFSLYQICKYFLSYNKYMELIKYLKFLTNSQPDEWWAGDRSFANIVIGLCYLLMNKPWKFVECITSSIDEKEIASSLVPDIIFNEELSRTVTSLPILQTNLVLKFIDIMENLPNPEPYTITLADFGNKIISESPEEDKDLEEIKSIFHTILFKNYLEIHRFEEARQSIMKNPDNDKQKDCLRQFIIVLSENNLLNSLVQFDYGNLSDEFVNIIHSRARASDFNGNLKDSFYSSLFSFHIKNGNYKAAATCMLELALRLDIELRNQGIYMSNSVAIEHLQMQTKAYLTCITVASLLPGDEQMFVFPAALGISYSNEDISNRTLVYKSCIGVDKDNEMEISQQDSIEEEGTERIIIDLSQIRKECNLIRSRLKVLRESPEHGFIQSGRLTKSLTLSSLLQLGLYWDAIKLCQDFDMGLEQVVTTIATRCAQVSKNCLDRPMLKEKENIVDSLEEISGKVDFASLGSLQKLLWKFLQELLIQYDTSQNGNLSIKACSKLLNGGMELLPAWLIDFVVDEKQAAGALLKLYIANGYLEPAVNLASRVLDCQNDDIYFLKQSFSSNKAQLNWVSYPVIFNLFDILDNMAQHKLPRAQEYYEKLDGKMKTMFHVMKQLPAMAIE